MLVGFPNMGLILFYRIEVEETNIFLLDNGKISVSTYFSYFCFQMQYDLFETDDNLSCILFNNKKLNTLELYTIKWEFDTSNLDMNKLRKLDDDKIGHDGDSYGGSSQRSSRRVQINSDDLEQ